MGWGGARAAVKNSKHSKALKLQPPLGIKCRVSWLVLIDHPLSDGLSLPSGKAAVCRLLARHGDNRGGTDFLPLLPPLLLLLHLSALPLPSPPPHSTPLLPAGVPHPNPKQAHVVQHISISYRKGASSPLVQILWGGGVRNSKARNMYTTACFIITSFLGPSYFPNNQQLKLIALSSFSPGKKKK